MGYDEQIRMELLEKKVRELEQRLDAQEQQNIGNTRLGPKRPRDDAEWIKAGDELGDRIIAEVQRRKGIMHYRNGREAKNGDKIVKLEGGKVVAYGVLHSATPGNDYCNGNIAIIQSANDYACMCDCLHVDDVADLLKEKELDKRPAGK